MKKPRIAITGGHIIDPANSVDQQKSLFVAEGKIISLGKKPDGFTTDLDIDVQGQIVCPGFVDLSARLREPGQEHKATITSETTAAARAGITTLCAQPDTIPVVDEPAVVELIKERTQLVGKARILPIGALTQGLNGERLSEMSALKQAGCIAVGNASEPIANTLVLRRALEYATTYGLLIIIRPEDFWLRDSGCVHEGAVGTRLGLPGIPESAEIVAVAQALALVEQVGARAHFTQLSCVRSSVLISRAQHDGIQVSADVAAHQLHLTEENVEDFDPMYHVNPPLRTVEDRDGLRQGVAHNVIAAICSDHQPHEEEAKRNSFPSTEIGMASLETLLPLTLRLVDEGVLTLMQAIERLTVGPAKVLGVDFGTLNPGSVADVCIFDPGAMWHISRDTWSSRGLNTPFWGSSMKGRVSHTLFGGVPVFKSDI